MKVTLYNQDGKTYEEVECADVQPHCGNFKLIVVSGVSRYIVTNLPFVCDGKLWTHAREPSPDEPKEMVKLLDNTGRVIQSWRNVQGLSYRSDIVSFKSDGQWYSVVGNVVIREDKDNDQCRTRW